MPGDTFAVVSREVNIVASRGAKKKELKVRRALISSLFVTGGRERAGLWL
jgi:hypothetical protein